jgi:thioesterase domain-containing protein/acyl carrier protein
MNINMFQGLKTVLSGGEKVSVHHFNQIRQVYPSLTLQHVYGPTENTTFTSSYTVDKLFKKDIPIGTPIANTTVYILDSNDDLVPIGVAGEICTGGDGLARGYMNDPVLTKEKFVAHPFEPNERIYRTGDLGRWLPDGAIEFLGRKDEQVKVRGYRIEPGEIENHLLQHEAVKEAVVIAKDFGPDSKELLAYVTLQEDLDVDELREYLKNRLPDYMIPAYFTKLDNLPLTPNGKVNKRALPAPDMSHQMAKGHYEAPETETEKQLALIWEEVLGHKGIGATDDFFDIGGHSLKVTKLIALIHNKMGIEVPLATVFKASTIRELTQYILDIAQFGIKEVDEAMILLNGVTEGKPIFALPPGTGDAAGYIQVADGLKPYAFYGFNFIEAETRLKDYADFIMDVDPDGPYLLFGYSAGGNLAYHVTKELENRGKCVSDIVMVDSAQFKEKIHFSDAEVKKRAEQFLSHESIAPYLTSPILWEKAFRIIKRYHDYISNSVDTHIVDANIHVLLCENSRSIYRDTDPEIQALLDGENSHDLPHEGTGRIIVSLPGWADVTRGTFKTYQGVGDHNHMLYQPHLENNIRILRNLIDRAYSSKK